MDRLAKVKSEIDALYSAKKEGRADWADWLYSHHIFSVAERAGEIAERFGGQKELAMAAGMLHDLADAVISRFNEQHQQESERIAKDILYRAGYSPEEVSIIVDDAIALHSCRNHTCPKTPEGRAMATADAVVHLQSIFYAFAYEKMKSQKTTEEIKAWALPKIERDFNEKIAFNEIRNETRQDYERLKAFFSNLQKATPTSPGLLN